MRRSRREKRELEGGRRSGKQGKGGWSRGRGPVGGPPTSSPPFPSLSPTSFFLLPPPFPSPISLSLIPSHFSFTFPAPSFCCFSSALSQKLFLRSQFFCRSEMSRMLSLKKTQNQKVCPRPSSFSKDFFTNRTVIALQEKSFGTTRATTL